MQLEPPERVSAGLVLFEGDQVWLMAPKGQFGGYEWTFPKGGVEEDEILLVAAERELTEETGLVGVCTRYLGSFEGFASTTHFWEGIRIGGTPFEDDYTPYEDGGRESALVRLVDTTDAFALLNVERDRLVLATALGLR